MATVFFSYSHKDEALRDQLEVQLKLLVRQGVIQTWHDRRIGGGEDFAREIDQHVETDDIILLLVSPDFLASDYCYEKEMLRALERHAANEAVVIPVILRPCLWKDAPFAKLQATPKDGTPVVMLPNYDQAFLEVAETIKAAAGRCTGKTASSAAFKQPKPMPQGRPIAEDRLQSVGPRSSNLAVAKQFTQRDKDAFELESFEYLARFFQNSAAELQARNPGVEATFRRIDANRFSAVIYKGGQPVSRCTIALGSQPYMSGITYAQSESGNGYNEALRVEADDQSLYLQSSGMAAMGGQRGGKGALTQEGAAEFYWSMLMRPLQQAGSGRCQRAPKFPRLWALKIPYFGDGSGSVINRSVDRRVAFSVAVRAAWARRADLRDGWRADFRG